MEPIVRADLETLASQINQLRQEVTLLGAQMSSVTRRLPPAPVGEVTGKAGVVEFRLDELVSLSQMESSYIKHVLGALRDSRTKAAEVLGVDPSTLYRRLARLEATSQRS